MANTGIRQLTTVVGGYAKRIWYSLNGTTPINELMSIDDAGKFKCASEQITGLAGTGNRMVVADASGNLSAGATDYIIEIPMSPTPVSTGININGGLGGKTIMLYFSAQWDAGDATSSGIYMVRCGFDGNNYSLVNIAESGYFHPAFSVVSGVLYISFPVSVPGIIRVTANK
jgi:hypothetical protein